MESSPKLSFIVMICRHKKENENNARQVRALYVCGGGACSCVLTQNGTPRQIAVRMPLRVTCSRSLGSSAITAATSLSVGILSSLISSSTRAALLGCPESEPLVLSSAAEGPSACSTSNAAVQRSGDKIGLAHGHPRPRLPHMPSLPADAGLDSPHPGKPTFATGAQPGNTTLALLVSHVVRPFGKPAEPSEVADMN